MTDTKVLTSEPDYQWWLDTSIKSLMAQGAKREDIIVVAGPDITTISLNGEIKYQCKLELKPMADAPRHKEINALHARHRYNQEYVATMPSGVKDTVVIDDVDLFLCQHKYRTQLYSMLRPGKGIDFKSVDGAVAIVVQPHADDYSNGWADAMAWCHQKIREENERLTAEHAKLKPSVFGGPTQRHNEIVAMSGVLVKIATLVFKARSPVPHG